jgi:phage shock protein PspC (stress-responsive transcriptional regulator)
MSVPPPTAPQPPAPPTSRLRRSADDRVVAGVCGGIARDLRVDPLVIRIAAVVLALLGGLGALAYVVAVLIIPADGEEQPLLRRAVDGEDRSLALGLLVGAVVLWAIVSDGWFLGVRHGWWMGTVVLTGAIVFGVVKLLDGRRADGAPPVAPAVADASGPGEEPTLVAPVPPRPRSAGRIALGATLVGIGLVGAIGALAGDGVRWDVLMACAVIVIGATLVIVAPFGGARALIGAGIALAAVTGIAAAADLHLRGGVGERTYHPATAAELRTDYHLAVGRLEVDTRDVVLPAGTTRVHPELGFGELVVRVPDTARVEVDAHASGGEVEVLGRDANGLDTDLHVAPARGDGPLLVVDARVGFGHIAVVRGDDPVGRGPRRPAVIGVGGLR